MTSAPQTPLSGGNGNAGPPPPQLPGGAGPDNTMPWLVIAISGGALSAVLFSGLAIPSVFSIALFFLVPAPLFMVGLAFGWLAAAVAALSALALMIVLLGMVAALTHALLAGGPVVWLSHLALQHRPAAGAMEGEPVDEAGREWYPEGRLLLWMAGFSAAAVILILLTQGLSLEDIRSGLMAMAERAVAVMPWGGALTADEKERFLHTFATLAPLSMAVLWEIALFVSFRLGLWLGSRFGLVRRPLAEFANMRFPQKALLLVAGVSLLALAPGVVGFFGQIAALAYMTAFALLGLAVVHAWLRDRPWAPAALGALYAALLLLMGLVAPALLLLGLAETGFGVRDAFLKGGGRGGGGGPPTQT